MRNIVLKTLSWVLLLFAVYRALGSIIQLPNSLGLAAAATNLFMGAIAFWGLQKKAGSWPELEAQSDTRPIIQQFEGSRLQIVIAPSQIAIKVPSGWHSVAIGSLFAILVVLPLSNICRFITEWIQTGTTTAIIGRFVLILISAPLLAFACPWWWFLGGELIELTPAGLRYRAGLWPFRRDDSFDWNQVQNLRRTPPRPMGIGYQVLFEYAPQLGMVHGIGRHLTTLEAGLVLQLLTEYQAGNFSSRAEQIEHHDNE